MAAGAHGASGLLALKARKLAAEPVITLPLLAVGVLVLVTVAKPSRVEIV